MNEHNASDFLQTSGSGEHVLFIGTDLSETITNLPSRNDLARGLAKQEGLDTSLSLAEVTQRVYQAGNRWKFTNYIRDALDTSRKSPRDFHKHIIELVKTKKVKTIITTAYDDLLEKAFQQAKIGINRIVSNIDISFANPDRATLIKLYGDLQQPDTLVITDSDHNNLIRDPAKDALINDVYHYFHHNTVVFLGYNLADPDFRFLFDQIAKGSFTRTAYAVWTNLPQPDINMWRDRGIVILDNDPWGILIGNKMTIVSQDKQENISDHQFKMAQRALAILEEQAAGYTTLTMPVHLRIELEEKRCEVGILDDRRRDNDQDIESPVLSKSLENTLQISNNSAHGIGKNWALLVGVNEYEDVNNYGKLYVCGKDVEAIQARIITGGFEPERIRLLTDHIGDNPTRANIIMALKAIADATNPSDILLFYYSGHGDEADQESYLVARDGRKIVLKDTAVPLSRVKTIMKEALARTKIIILDSCHSGADIKGKKGPQTMSPEFIKRVFEESEGFSILASCKQGQLSYEWRSQERSVFTHFLLNALSGDADLDNKGFVTIHDANRYVVDRVKLWASQNNVSQTPTLQCEMAGEIILVRY